MYERLIAALLALVSSARRRSFSKEPAIWLGLAVAVVTAVRDAYAGGLDWHAAVPAVAGVVIRFFVSPAAATTEPPGV